MDATYKGKQIKYLVPTHVYSIQFDKPKHQQLIALAERLKDNGEWITDGVK